MSVVQRTKDWIDRGRSDKVNHIPTGITKLDEYTDGLTQSTQILLMAETTVGKTAFTRDKYLLSSFEYFQSVNDISKLDLEIVDMSLEMPIEFNTAAAISRKIFLDYQKVVVPKKILSGLSDEYKPLVDDIINTYITDYNKICSSFEEDITPTKYHDVLMEVAKKNGKFSIEGKYISECGIYTPNNPNKFIIIHLDTINLAELDSGHTTIKSTIDRISRISVWFKKKCGFTIIILQQINSEIGTTDRKRFGVTTPKLTDGEDSKRPSKDADIVMGLFDPCRHLTEEEKWFRGYNMEILRSWYRSAHIIKNRRGENNKAIDLKFDGAVGIFYQLPTSKEMDERAYINATRH